MDKLMTISKVEVAEGTSTRTCGKKFSGDEEDVCGEPVKAIWLISNPVEDIQKGITGKNTDRMVALCEKHSAEFEEEVAGVSEEAYDFDSKKLTYIKREP